MSTVAQIEANRANAQASTGPKSEAGVNACKFNATKTGLTGKQIVIKGEDPAEYDAFRAQLMIEYAPTGEIETLLADEIVQGQWRLRRAKLTERQVLDKFGPLECVTEPEARRAFSLITRYLNGIERTIRRATADLEKLRKVRKEEAIARGQATIMDSFLKYRQSRPASVQPPIGSVSHTPSLAVLPVADSSVNQNLELKKQVSR